LEKIPQKILTFFSAGFAIFTTHYFCNSDRLLQKRLYPAILIKIFHFALIPLLTANKPATMSLRLMAHRLYFR